MSDRSRRMLGNAAILGVGLVLAVFFVFQAMFSDAIHASDKVTSLLLVTIVYGTIGMGMGYKSARWETGLWLSAPAVLLGGLYTMKEYAWLWFNLALMILAVGAALGGACTGARLKASRGN